MGTLESRQTSAHAYRRLDSQGDRVRQGRHQIAQRQCALAGKQPFRKPAAAATVTNSGGVASSTVR